MRLSRIVASTAAVLVTSTSTVLAVPSTWKLGEDGGQVELTRQRPPTSPDDQPKPGDALFTNTVSYCSEAKAVLVEEFDIAYWRHNNSLTFSFSFASVQSNLNVQAGLYLNDYGNAIFNESINICNVLSGLLCPLPQTNLSGFGTYPLPDNFQSQIPSIAWTVPDLEAYARIELVDQRTNQVAACLQATLSNGWSTKHKGVAWASGMLTLAAVLVGLTHAIFFKTISPAIYRWFDVLFLYQATAASGLLHLNYPLVYSDFTQNFYWALALFPSKQMQNSIGALRSHTGGDMASDAFNNIEYINRRLSPYNDFSRGVNLTSTIAGLQSLNTYLADMASNAGEVVKRAPISSLIAQTSSTSVTTGIPVYTNGLDIPQANAYDTVFFYFLAFLAIFIAFHAILGGVVFTLARTRKRGWAVRLRETWWEFCAANALRTCFAFFFPIFIFGFYQWNIGSKDSGLSIFFSVLGMLMVLVPLTAAFVASALRARRPRLREDISPLYTDYRFYHSVGNALYRQYRQRYHFFWFAPSLLAMIARAGFVAFGQNNGWAQVIGCMVVEFMLLCLQIGLHPHKDRMGDWISPLMTLFRLILFGLLVAFIEDVGVKAIPRVIIGIVGIAVVGIATVILFIGLLINTGYGIFWCKTKARVEDGTELEKDRYDEKDAAPGSASLDADNAQFLDNTAYNTQGYKTHERAASDTPTEAFYNVVPMPYAEGELGSASGSMLPHDRLSIGSDSDEYSQTSKATPATLPTAGTHSHSPFNDPAQGNAGLARAQTVHFDEAYPSTVPGTSGILHHPHGAGAPQA